jgi:hypothetical protein
LSSNGTSLRVHHQKFRLVRNGHESVAFLSKRRHGRVCRSTANNLGQSSEFIWKGLRLTDNSICWPLPCSMHPSLGRPSSWRISAVHAHRERKHSCHPLGILRLSCDFCKMPRLGQAHYRPTTHLKRDQKRVQIFEKDICLVGRLLVS